MVIKIFQKLARILFVCYVMVMTACSNENIDKRAEEDNSVVQRQENSFKEKKQKMEEETYTEGKELQVNIDAKLVKETKLALDNSRYYYETGIWNFWLNLDGRPETLAVHDDTGELMLLSWKNKKQEEKKFPLKQNKFTSDEIFLPCRYGNIEGYFNYSNDIIKIYNKEGNKKKKIDVSSCFRTFEEMIDAELIDKNECKKYNIHQFYQSRDNEICFIIKTWTEKRLNNYPAYVKKSSWDAFYLLKFDMKKKKLISIDKSDNWILGVDKNYIFAFNGEFSSDNRMFLKSNFSNGWLEVTDRKTGMVVNQLEIPNDIEDEDGSNPSQHFDFQNGILYFANRSGVYALSGEDEKWRQIVRPGDTSYINTDYFIADFKVRNESCFYLLFVTGLEDESADLLVKYKLS